MKTINKPVSFNIAVLKSYWGILKYDYDYFQEILQQNEQECLDHLKKEREEVIYCTETLVFLRGRWMNEQLPLHPKINKRVEYLFVGRGI